MCTIFEENSNALRLGAHLAWYRPFAWQESTSGRESLPTLRGDLMKLPSHVPVLGLDPLRHVLRAFVLVVAKHCPGEVGGTMVCQMLA